LAREDEEKVVGLVIRLIQWLFSLYSICIIARVFLEMLLGPYHGVVVFLRAITEPLLAPIRRWLPALQTGGMGWDLSPMIALLLLWVVERVLIVVLTRVY
jgi:YggT family protein